MSTESLSHAELVAAIARLKQENAARKAGGTWMKVSEKGGVSVYGLGRFPVTLYKEQWEKLLDMAEGILTFIDEHDHELKAKD